MPRDLRESEEIGIQTFFRILLLQKWERNFDCAFINNVYQKFSYRIIILSISFYKFNVFLYYQSYVY